MNFYCRVFQIVFLVAAFCFDAINAGFLKRCGLDVTKDNIANSWQSSSVSVSFLGNKILCFKDHTHDKTHTPNYFATVEASRSGVSGGYEWFAVKLRRTEYIHSVGLETTNSPLVASSSIRSLSWGPQALRKRPPGGRVVDGRFQAAHLAEERANFSRRPRRRRPPTPGRRDPRSPRGRGPGPGSRGEGGQLLSLLDPDGSSAWGKDDYKKAENIEVWTAPKEVDFGSQRCTNQRMHVYFKNTTGLWELCGQTSKNNFYRNMMTVSCRNQPAVMILLRKNVAQEREPVKQEMSFYNLRINFMNDVTAQVQPSVIGLVNSQVKVSCQFSCTANASDIVLQKKSSGEWLATGSKAYVIRSMQQKDAGDYVCSFKDETLSTAHLGFVAPPAGMYLAKNASGCQSKSVNGMKFALTSLEAIPTPKHVCQALDAYGNSIIMHLVVVAALGEAVPITSHWICLGCCIANNVTVICSAIQRMKNGHLLWNSTSRWDYNWNMFESDLSDEIYSGGGKTNWMLISIISVASIAGLAIFASSLALMWKMKSSKDEGDSN